MEITHRFHEDLETARKVPLGTRMLRREILGIDELIPPFDLPQIDTMRAHRYSHN